MMERSSFSIEPNLEGQQADEASKLYGQHLEDPSNPVPIEEAKKHYEENQEAYHNQAAMDMSAAGKDVNTPGVRDYTTTEDGITTHTTVIKGRHTGDVGISSGNHPGARREVRIDADIEGELNIHQSN